LLMLNRETLSPCGLYCGVCGIYLATLNNDEGLRAKLARAYGMPPEDLVCRGCRSDTVISFCRVCGIKECADGKGIEGCAQCDAFPCDKVEAFPVAEGKAHILTAVPRWRELGTEEWVAGEERRYTCRSCGNRLFRGARKCRSCGAMVADQG
jgi:hypothetical protein